MHTLKFSPGCEDVVFDVGTRQEWILAVEEAWRGVGRHVSALECWVGTGDVDMQWVKVPVSIGRVGLAWYRQWGIVKETAEHVCDLAEILTIARRIDSCFCSIDTGNQADGDENGVVVELFKSAR